jgi:hypothetical protein
VAIHEVDIWNRALSRLGDLRAIVEAGIAASGATTANPVVVTTATHGYADDDLVMLRGFSPQTALNGRVFKIEELSTTTFSLLEEDGLLYGTYAAASDFAHRITGTKAVRACFDAWTDIRDEVLRAHPWNCLIKRSRLSRLAASKTVSSATAANPVVCTTSAAHGYSSGDIVLLEGFDQMTEVNDRYFTIVVVTTTTFQLAGEDGSDYTAESTGGTSKKALTPFTPDSDYGNRYALPTDSLRILELPDDHDEEWTIEGDWLLTDAGITVPIRYIQRVQDPTQYEPLLVSALSARLAVELAEELTQSNNKRDLAAREYEEILDKARQTDALEDSAKPYEEDDWVRARL